MEGLFFFGRKHSDSFVRPNLTSVFPQVRGVDKHPGTQQVSVPGSVLRGPTHLTSVQHSSGSTHSMWLQSITDGIQNNFLDDCVHYWSRALLFSNDTQQIMHHIATAHLHAAQCVTVCAVENRMLG